MTLILVAVIWLIAWTWFRRWLARRVRSDRMRPWVAALLAGLSWASVPLLVKLSGVADLSLDVLALSSVPLFLGAAVSGLWLFRRVAKFPSREEPPRASAS